MDESLDFSFLAESEPPEAWLVSGMDPQAVMDGKVVGLELLESFGVVAAVPRAQAEGHRIVTTRWEIQPKGDVIKCRIVAREYKWLELRDDVFAPASSAITSRVIDHIGLKHPLYVTFIMDCVSAYYQTEETEECYAEPCPEWLAARAAKGLSTDVCWQLRKQLPGRRAAGLRWTEHVAAVFSALGFSRCPQLPQFMTNRETECTVEIHMDDFHGCGPPDAVASLLTKLQDALVSKVSAPIVSGRYQHLKRFRNKLEQGTFVSPNVKHVDAILCGLGLEKANPAITPFMDDHSDEESPPLSAERASLYRSCVGSAIYLSSDRVDIQREVGLLAASLATPTEYDFKQLVRLGRYLRGTRHHGIWMERPDATLPCNVVILKCFSDTDWAAHRKSRRSVTCGVFTADGCPLAAFARRQHLVSLSSGEAEYYGMVSVACEGLLFKTLYEFLGYTVSWSLGVDSSAAKAMAQREGVGKVRHLDCRSLWLQRAVKELKLRIQKVSGPLNVADIGTKAHTEKELVRLREAVGLYDGEGLEDVPELTAGAIAQIPVARHSGWSTRAGVVAATALLPVTVGAMNDSSRSETRLTVPGPMILLLSCVLGALLLWWLFGFQLLVARRRRQRTVMVQSPVTYRRELARPRFMVLSLGVDGAFPID